MDINGVEMTPDMYWVMGLGILINLLVRYFYCNTIRQTLKLVNIENRHMQPNEAWLAMIPIFSIYWNFKIAERLSNSLTNEFFDRQIAEEERPGLVAGITYAIFILLANIPITQGYMVFMGLLAFIYFIRYWIKVSNFKALLIEHNKFLDFERKSTIE